jgi:hypothetical protein
MASQIAARIGIGAPAPQAGFAFYRPLPAIAQREGEEHPKAA